MVYHDHLKREIPKGWEVKSIPQIAPILTGKKDANHATVDGAYHFFTCADEALKCDDFAFDGRAILLAGNGSFGVKIYEGKFNDYQRTYVLIPNEKKHFASVWFAVKNSVASLTKGSRGSIVKFLTKGDIESIFVPLPPENSHDLFAPINNALLLTLANHQPPTKPRTHHPPRLAPPDADERPSAGGVSASDL
jgi:type I restriction enzyme, S subunit